MLNKTSKFSRKTRNALSFVRPCVSQKERLHTVNEIWAIFISLTKFSPKKMKRSDLVNDLNALYRTLPLLPLVPLSLSLPSFFPFFLLHCTACGILVPRPDITFAPLALKAQSYSLDQGHLH